MFIKDKSKVKVIDLGKELWVERFREWLKRIERDARKIISDAEM